MKDTTGFPALMIEPYDILHRSRDDSDGIEPAPLGQGCGGYSPGSSNPPEPPSPKNK